MERHVLNKSRGGGIILEFLVNKTSGACVLEWLVSKDVLGEIVLE